MKYIYSILINEFDKKVGVFRFNPMTGYISHVVVYKPYRGMGYGNQLVKLIIEIGRHSQVNYIWLHVQKDNLLAKHLYLKYGFEIVASGKEVSTYIQNEDSGLILVKKY